MPDSKEKTPVQEERPRSESAKAKVLSVSVAVHDPETNEGHVFLAGDTPPDWAVKAITNPNVWVDKDGNAHPDTPTPGPSASILWADTPLVSEKK